MSHRTIGARSQERRDLTVGGSRRAIVESNAFPIVALGASAGGLVAFEAFFSALSQGAETGMAYVLIQHLAPNHPSLLVELVARHTSIEVVEVTEGMVIRPNRVHVIPPGRDLAISGGIFRLSESASPPGLHLPIDMFFRSLAEDARERAIAIVLSGNGSDGTVGLRAIKDFGGMTLAQTPGSAESDGMPRTAIDAGIVDHVLDPADMPGLLPSWAAHLRTQRDDSTPTLPTIDADVLGRICKLLHTRSGHDFSGYKRSTLVRRIERRMAVQGIRDMEGYADFLDHESPEVDLLFRDILIGVTSFFRDPDAFRDLQEQVLPGLVACKVPGETIRVWVAGCSTGEEAYSIAILLADRLDASDHRNPVQVFATDIDPRAIAAARAGLFSVAIAESVAADRLARHFVLEPDGRRYRIAKRIRDMLVFSEHDLILDPPFSRLDLVSCRNLLIYFDPELQKKVLPLFHYALHPGGILFLGSSESVGEGDDLFETRIRASKIFVRRSEPSSAVGGGAALRGSIPSPVPPWGRPQEPAARAPMREFAEHALLQHTTPSVAVVDEHGAILYLHGRTGEFLEPTPGETGQNNILRMAREGLRTEIVTGLRKAASTKGPVRFSGLEVASGESVRSLDLRIVPLQDPGVGKARVLFLVCFEDARLVDPILGRRTGSDADERIAALDLELRAKEDFLRSANDDLKRANEGMQSVNEELQSTNEELETSKEELQSVNEEFATVNAELQARVAELSRANNDMNNLLAGTGIGTVFLDRELRILRFTPAATTIINLIAGDLGRPVGHIASNLVGYDGLVADVRSVLSTLVPREVEVHTIEGGAYTMRLLPYRTLENVVEGVVITFVASALRPKSPSTSSPEVFP